MHFRSCDQSSRPYIVRQAKSDFYCTRLSLLSNKPHVKACHPTRTLFFWLNHSGLSTLSYICDMLVTTDFGVILTRIEQTTPASPPCREHATRPSMRFTDSFGIKSTCFKYVISWWLWKKLKSITNSYDSLILLLKKKTYPPVKTCQHVVIQSSVSTIMCNIIELYTWFLYDIK